MKDITKLKDEVRKNDAVYLIVSNLEAEYAGKSGAFNVLDFLEKQKGLSPIVQSLARNITEANKQVKVNVMEYFSTAFGGK